jgi:hypothetical protein
MTQTDTQNLIGLEFLLSQRFVERACDFILGKKSPLCSPGEKRFEMGSSFSGPNFTALTRIITKVLSDPSLLQKYPLSEVEKKMFMHSDFLKLMLQSQATAKQFGQCLANMCRENLKLSTKVAKVFLKSIANSNFDSVKTYLKALKPFVLMEDSLKAQRLEWVFGFSQIISRKNYREERYKYGLEFVDRLAEAGYTYVSPIGGT